MSFIAAAVAKGLTIFKTDQWAAVNSLQYSAHVLHVWPHVEFQRLLLTAKP